MFRTGRRAWPRQQPHRHHRADRRRLSHRPGHGEGRDDADRRGTRRGALRCAPRRKSSAAAPRPTPSSASPLSASAPPISARSNKTSSAMLRRRSARRPASAIATSLAAHGPGTGRCFVYVTPDGERTMNTFLGASSYLSPDDVDEALRALGAHRLSRRLYVGPPGSQGGVPQGRPHRPRGRRARGADAVGRLLRRPLPRRIHRSHAHRHRRHRVRQHRRGAVALSDDAISTRRWTRSPPKASRAW